MQCKDATEPRTKWAGLNVAARAEVFILVRDEQVSNTWASRSNSTHNITEGLKELCFHQFHLSVFSKYIWFQNIYGSTNKILYYQQTTHSPNCQSNDIIMPCSLWKIPPYTTDRQE